MMATMDKPVTTLYGIRNCDTVKSARAVAGRARRAYTFHDFKLQGVPTPALDHWLAAVGWETLLNRQGTDLAQARRRHENRRVRRRQRRVP
jgi:arsenate reductase-like glutaredoxin family protein